METMSNLVWKSQTIVFVKLTKMHTSFMHAKEKLVIPHKNKVELCLSYILVKRFLKESGKGEYAIKKKSYTLLTVMLLLQTLLVDPTMIIPRM